MCIEEKVRLIEKAKAEIEELSRDPKVAMLVRNREVAEANYKIAIGAAREAGYQEGSPTGQALAPRPGL